MIKIKEGYAKLIGASALGAANRLLLSNGGDKDVSDFASAESLNNYLPLSGNNLNSPITGDVYFAYQKSIAFTASNGTLQGALGMDDYFNPIWWTGNGTYTIFHSGNDGHGSGLDADTLDGYHASYENNRPWGTIPVIHNLGWIDIGSQIAFHHDNTTGSSYSTLLQTSGNNSNIVTLPSTSGTLALTSLLPNVTDYYWANIKVSNASSTTTSPVFAYPTSIYSYFTNGSSIVGYVGRGNSDNNNLYLGNYTKSDVCLYTDDDLTKSITLKSGGNLQVNGDIYSPNYEIHNNGANPFIKLISGNNQFSYFLALDGKSYIGSTSTKSLVVDVNGNVGIGTESPRYSLQVSGNIFLNNTLYFTNSSAACIKFTSHTVTALGSYPLPSLGSSGLGLFTRPSGGTDEGGIIITEDTCMIFNSADSGWSFQVHNTDLNQKDFSGTNGDGTKSRIFGIVDDGSYVWSRGGFLKNGSSDSYVLLGGGSHKLESDLSVYSSVNSNLTKSLYTANVTGNSHSEALSSYFNSYKTSIPRNKAISLYSNAYGNGSQYMGYFLSGYNDTPYGGFFVAHYDACYYVGISNGKFSEQRILTNTNYTSYLGYIGTTAVTSNSTARELAGITRISNSANNILYLGNSDNSSWVYTLDICSHSGTSKWAININGAAWFSKLMVGIAYNGTGSNYAVNVSGDSHVTGWSRAGSGFYIHDKGVHFMNNRAYPTGGEITLTLGNEFMWGASSTDLYFNYRAASVGTTVTNFIWNAGSDSTYASHTMGNLYIKTASLSTALPTYNNAPLKFNATFNATNTSNSRYQPWISGMDSDSSHGYGVTISNGLYRDPGHTSGGYYIGIGWDGNANSVMWNFNRNGETVCPGPVYIYLPSSNRRAGIIGTYDPNRAAAIWTMGASYQIAADGTSFGSLYGAAYAYFGSGYTFGENYSVGHSFVWCLNGTVFAALGNHVWVRNYVYAAHFYENSDIRYKTIINNLAIKANQLANLPLFDFKWLDNEDLLNTGTSAQAVQELLPYIVSGTDKLTLDYGVLGTIAGITACRELTEQEKEINELKEQIKFLKDEINNLKTNKLWQS